MFKLTVPWLTFDILLESCSNYLTDKSITYQLMFIFYNLLRIGKDPLELYYAQYFVKLLYLAIKERHLKDVKLEQRRQFVCFRGGMMSENELNEIIANQGEHI